MKRRISGMVSALLLWPAFVLAQATGTGAVTGRIVDSSGAVLPGVTVMMKSPQALGQFSAVTDAQGLYRIANLPPAAYETRAELQGFQTVVQTVNVRVATTLAVDFTLAVGAMTETVNVTAETPIVDPERSGLSINISNQALTQVPISTQRRYQDVWALAPGVFVRPDQADINPSVNSRGTSENSTKLDGMDVTDPFGGGVFSVSFNYDAIQDIQIKTLGAEAEDGGRTGGFMSIVTKSGGNDVHGSAAFFVIPQSFNSSNVVGVAPNQRKSIQPDFTVGGPIEKNRVWFFGAYRRVQEDQTLNNAQVPLQRRGNQIYVKGTADLGGNQRLSASFQWDRTNADNAVLRTTGTGAPSLTAGLASATPALAAPSAWGTLVTGGPLFGMNYTWVMRSNLLFQFIAQTRSTASPSRLRFDVSFVPQIHDGPITGRAFVMVTRSIDKVPEPRLQIGRTGVPFFGRDVERLQPEKIVSIDATDLGTPIDSINDIPAGDYYVQSVVVVYSEFRRADGHVVWMHDDRWEGQRWSRAAGTLYSEVQKVHIDPNTTSPVTVIKLVATKVVPPVEVPADTKYVKRIKFQSPMLTKFWGRPIHLGAVVLLPRDYDRETMSYPVNYVQGHFSIAPPYAFDEQNEFSKAWLSDNFPRMIAVTFQHPTPYFDDSYAVNSVNNGPYGDAIMQELIPEIEKRFRVIREPYARILSGGSTGGWEAAALQIFHADFFGGAWSYCPDPVTFMDVEGVNIYEDENAFYKMYDWRKVPTANSRMVNGQLVMTSQQRNYFELVNGTHGRSGEQIDIWSAVFGPIGKDGYFEPLFDKRTGVINKDVAQYWRENYDLLYYLRKNWSTVGAKLVDKLFFYTGDVDTYSLNNSTKELEKWMKTTTNPHYEGFFMYGDNKPHCWSGPVSAAERLKEIAHFIQRKRPEGATTSWWTY